MIVSYFNNTKPINIVVLSVVLSFLYFSSLIITDTPLFSIENFEKYLLVISTFFLYNHIINNGVLSAENNFGIFFYVLVSGLLFYIFFDIKILLANITLMIALKELLVINSNEFKVKEKLFNFGFFIGIASLVYPLCIFFFILGIIGVLVFNKVLWKNFLIPIVGLVIPYFFVFVINDLFHYSLTSNYFPNFKFDFSLVYQSIVTKIIFGYLSILFLWSVFSVFSKINLELVYFKAFNILLIVQLILTITIILFYKNKGENTLFLLFPLSVFMANAFSLIQKKRIVNIVLLLGIILVILNYTF